MLAILIPFAQPVDGLAIYFGVTRARQRLYAGKMVPGGVTGPIVAYGKADYSQSAVSSYKYG
jgi:hypothetical protein